VLAWELGLARAAKMEHKSVLEKASTRAAAWEHQFLWVEGKAQKSACRWAEGWAL